MTLGQSRVRASFNPSGKTLVDELKLHAAELIDLCEEMRGDNAEINRCCALAQTAFEEGAMWAVKAATAETKPDKVEYPSDHPAPGDLGSVPL